MNKQKDRLVELIGSKVCEEYSPNCDEYEPHTCEKCYANFCKVGDLADAILADGWMRPPCKVGDVVWLTGNMELYTKEEICSRKIISVQMLQTGELLMHFKDGCFPSDAVGVYAFPTKEEAEVKLKEGVQGC